MDEAGVWMTYDELAQARGVDRQSARRLANRRKLRREEDNQGIIRVLVPPAVADREDMSADKPAGASADASADMSAVTEILIEVKALRAEDRARIDRLEADITALERRAAQAEAALVFEKAAREALETDAVKWKDWLASGLGARLLAVFWKA